MTRFAFAGLLGAAAMLAAAGQAQAKTSWSLVYSKVNSSNAIAALDAISPEQGWVLAVKDEGQGQQFYGLRTTNGTTWDEMMLPSGYQMAFFLSISFADSKNGWIGGMTGKDLTGGTGGRVWRTNDGGMSWKEEHTSATGTLGQVQAMSTGQMFAAAGKGVMVYDGASYVDTSIEVPEGLGITNVSMLNGTCGYAMAGAESEKPAGSQLYWTSDGGLTWEGRGSKLGYTLTRMSWVSATQGWAAGEQGGKGIIARTVDGGLTWTPAGLPDHPPLPNPPNGDPTPVSTCSDVKFFDNLRGVAACNACTGGCDSDAGDPSFLSAFARTEDGGQTWTLDPDYEAVMGGPFAKFSALFYAAFPDPNHGFIAGKNNVILRYVADTEEPAGWGPPECTGGGNTGGSGSGGAGSKPGGVKPAEEDSGCGCHAGAAGAAGVWGALALGLLAFARRRRS